MEDELLAVPVAKTDKTLAFHARMKIAPVPNKNESKNAIVETLMLLNKIDVNVPGDAKLAVVYHSPFISVMVLICSEKIVSNWPLSIIVAQNEVATTTPRKKYVKTLIVLPCFS